MRPHAQPPLPPTHTHAPWPGDEMHLLHPRSRVLPCLPPAITWAGMGEPCGVPPVPGKGLVDPMSPPALGPLVQTSGTRVILTVTPLAGDRYPVLAPAAAASQVARPHVEPGSLWGQPGSTARGHWGLSPTSPRSFFLFLPLCFPPAPATHLHRSSEKS